MVVPLSEGVLFACPMKGIVFWAAGFHRAHAASFGRRPRRWRRRSAWQVNLQATEPVRETRARASRRAVSGIAAEPPQLWALHDPNMGRCLHCSCVHLQRHRPQVSWHSPGRFLRPDRRYDFLPKKNWHTYQRSLGTKPVCPSMVRVRRSWPVDSARLE